MKLNIDYDNKTITLQDDWNLYDFIDHIETIIGVESEEHNKWTIKQDIKTLVVPQKEIVFKESPLSQPYKPFGNQPTIMYQPSTCSSILPCGNGVQVGKELITNTYSHT